MKAIKRVKSAYKRAPEIGANLMVELQMYFAADGWTEEEQALWEGLKRWMQYTEATRIGVEHAIRMLGCGDIDNRLNATVNGYRRAFERLNSAYEGIEKPSTADKANWADQEEAA